MLPNNLQKAFNSYDKFNVSDSLKMGWELVSKRQLGLFIATSIVYIAMSIVMVFIPILGQIYGFLISPVIALGFYYMADRTYKKQELEFSHFFDGLSAFPPNISTILFKTLITIAFMLPFFYFVVQAMGGVEFLEITDPKEQQVFIAEHLDSTKFALIGLTALPVYFIMFIYQYASLFTIFYNISGWEALEASRQFVMKHFGKVLLLNIAQVAIILLGFIFTCGIAILILQPFFATSQYAAFASMTALHEDNELDITDHFITR